MFLAYKFCREEREHNQPDAKQSPRVVQTRLESEVNRLFWKWLQEIHPITYETVLRIVDLISIIAIIISVVAIWMR